MVVRSHRRRAGPQRRGAGADGCRAGRDAGLDGGKHSRGLRGRAGLCGIGGPNHRVRLLPHGGPRPRLARSARPAAAGSASRIYCGAPSHLRLRLTSSMDRRVKERLVGASILVVLIVLIAPELLSGPATGPVSPKLPVSAPEPVRNVTVDLATSKAPAPEPAVEAAPASSVQPAEARGGGAASAAVEPAQTPPG